MGNITMDPKIKEFTKVERVILSCKTQEQFRIAYRFYRLWMHKNKEWIPNLHNGGTSYLDGYLIGLLKARKQEFGI